MQPFAVNNCHRFSENFTFGFVTEKNPTWMKENPVAEDIITGTDFNTYITNEDGDR